MVSLFRPSPLFGRSTWTPPPAVIGIINSAGTGFSLGQGKGATGISSEFNTVDTSMFSSPVSKLFGTHSSNVISAFFAIDDDGIAYAVGSQTAAGSVSGIVPGLRVTGSHASTNVFRKASIDVQVPSGWKKIACAGYNTVAIGVSNNGLLYSWGQGILGNGSASGDVPFPTQIATDITDWIDVAAGNSHFLALRSTGQIYAWGSNGSGATGRGTTSGNTLTPTLMNGSINTGVTRIAAGQFFSLAISNGELIGCGYNGNRAWGYATQQTSLVSVGAGSGWTDISSGANYSLGIRNGELWGVGRGLGYQLGNNSTSLVSVWTMIDNSGTWTKVVAGPADSNTSGGAYGSAPSAGIKDGALYRWGLNDLYQLGTGDTEPLTIPTQVGSYTDWIDVALTRSAIMALRAGE